MCASRLTHSRPRDTVCHLGDRQCHGQHRVTECQLARYMVCLLQRLHLNLCTDDSKNAFFPLVALCMWLSVIASYTHDPGLMLCHFINILVIHLNIPEKAGENNLSLEHGHISTLKNRKGGEYYQNILYEILKELIILFIKERNPSQCSLLNTIQCLIYLLR